MNNLQKIIVTAFRTTLPICKDQGYYPAVKKVPAPKNRYTYTGTIYIKKSLFQGLKMLPIQDFTQYYSLLKAFWVT